MKDRHYLLILIFAAFIGTLVFVSNLSSNSAVASNLNKRNIPTDLSEELGLPDSSSKPVEVNNTIEPLSITIEQTELERLDTLSEKLSENHTLIDDEMESRVLIGAVYVK